VPASASTCLFARRPRPTAEATFCARGATSSRLGRGSRSAVLPCRRHGGSDVTAERAEAPCLHTCSGQAKDRLVASQPLDEIHLPAVPVIAETIVWRGRRDHARPECCKEDPACVAQAGINDSVGRRTALIWSDE
jgi:hypothetical protein